MGTAKDLTFEVLLPTETCAECGKQFVRKGRRSEWGYYVRTQRGYSLFCSGPCCKKFEDRQFMESVRHVASTVPYECYKLVTRDGLRQYEALKITGLKSYSAVTALILHQWRELEWLEKHNWEVAG